MQGLHWGFVDSAPCFLSPVTHGPETSKDDGNCNQQLRKYAGHFFFLIAFGKMALQICQLIFFFPGSESKTIC